MTPKTSGGTWGKGDLLCEYCGRALKTEWVQKPGAPHITARHKRCPCQMQAAKATHDKIWTIMEEILRPRKK